MWSTLLESRKEGPFSILQRCHSRHGCCSSGRTSGSVLVELTSWWGRKWAQTDHSLYTMLSAQWSKTKQVTGLLIFVPFFLWSYNFYFAYDPFVAKKKFDHLIDMHLMIWNSWKWKPKKVRKRILPSRLSSASLQHGRHFEKMRNLNDRVSGFHHHGLH